MQPQILKMKRNSKFEFNYFSLEFQALRVLCKLLWYENYEIVHMSAVADQDDDISYVSQIVFL